MIPIARYGLAGATFLLSCAVGNLFYAAIAKSVHNSIYGDLPWSFETAYALSALAFLTSLAVGTVLWVRKGQEFTTRSVPLVFALGWVVVIVCRFAF